MGSKDKKNKDEPRPRRGRRSRTPEENIKKLVFKWLEEMSASDPQLREVMIAKWCGIDVRQIDRLAAEKEKLQVELVKQAIKMIKDDSTLLNTIVRQKAFELAGMKDPALEPREPPPDPIEEMIKKAEQKQRLDTALGIRQPSVLENLIQTFANPQFLGELLKTVNALTKTKKSNQPASTSPHTKADEKLLDFKDISPSAANQASSSPINIDLPPVQPPSPAPGITNDKSTMPDGSSEPDKTSLGSSGPTTD